MKVKNPSVPRSKHHVSVTKTQPVTDCAKVLLDTFLSKSFLELLWAGVPSWPPGTPIRPLGDSRSVTQFVAPGGRGLPAWMNSSSIRKSSFSWNLRVLWFKRVISWQCILSAQVGQQARCVQTILHVRTISLPLQCELIHCWSLF